MNFTHFNSIGSFNIFIAQRLCFISNNPDDSIGKEFDLYHFALLATPEERKEIVKEINERLDKTLNTLKKEAAETDPKEILEASLREINKEEEENPKTKENYAAMMRNMWLNKNNHHSPH